MSRLIWFVAWAGVLIWSLFCAAAYGVVDIVGGWFARNADLFSSDPQTVEWIFRVFSTLQGLSTGVVLVGWGTVSLMILAVPWLLDRMVGRVPQVPPGAPAPDWLRRGQPGGVIDLGPDQYSVGPPGPGDRRGPTPQVPRRP